MSHGDDDNDNAGCLSRAWPCDYALSYFSVKTHRAQGLGVLGGQRVNPGRCHGLGECFQARGEAFGKGVLSSPPERSSGLPQWHTGGSPSASGRCCQPEASWGDTKLRMKPGGASEHPWSTVPLSPLGLKPRGPQETYLLGVTALPSVFCVRVGRRGCLESAWRV